MATIVEAKGLCKKYDGFAAVAGLDLQIEEGEIFGLLGPNGAGKTTTILMLMGLTEPSSGTVQVCGYDPVREPLKVKRVTGYLPERVGFYEDLTARQNLRYTAELNRLPKGIAEERIARSLAAVGLSKVADQEVRTFSRGMKQRLGIADVLVKEPKLVFLDEPTSGIDPEGVGEILTIIQGMINKGITIVFCSHQLHLVERICTRVGILARGRLVAEGPIQHLGRQAMGGGKYRIKVKVNGVNPQLVNSIEQIAGVREVQGTGDTLFVNCDQDLRPQIARVIVDSGISLVGMETEEYSLEAIYTKYFTEAQQ
jgi:ABC-2 type transport system ATP-binding protein